MGQLVNPTGFRVGFSREWFFGVGRFSSSGYVKTFSKDFRVLEFLEGLFFNRKIRYCGFYFSHYRIFFQSKQSYLVSYLYLPDLFKMTIRFSFYLQFLKDYLYRSLSFYNYGNFLKSSFSNLKDYGRVLFELQNSEKLFF